MNSFNRERERGGIDVSFKLILYTCTSINSDSVLGDVVDVSRESAFHRDGQ